MIIINPYESVDWANTPKIKACSHEHIFMKSQVKYAYDRGIRYFACVNYLPSAPSYPLSGWSGTFLDFTSPTNLTLTDIPYSGSVVSFVDKDGNTVYTDDLVQLPNAEHPLYANISGSHFNVLGSLFAEPGYGNRNTGEWSDEALGMKLTSWRAEHKIYGLADINSQYLAVENQLFPGKIFGTINHNNTLRVIRNMLDTCPDVFKAMEVVNQGSGDGENDRNVSYREVWDTLLTEGRRLWGTSVIDWQTLRTGGKERLGACNVLLINGYNSMTMLEKSEAGLDAYISGCYIPSGPGNETVTDLSVTGESIHFSVSGNPDKLVVSSALSHDVYNDISEIDVPLADGMIYLRFEAWYHEEGELTDFLLTNPIFIEGEIPPPEPEEDDTAKIITLIL